MTETDKYIEENIGLVHSIAKRFLGRNVEYEDLVSIGSIGLVKAAQRFDESLNCKFSTYAFPLIMGEIKRYLRDNNIIKIPRRSRENLIKINYVKDKLKSELGREPTINDIVNETGLGIDEILDAIEYNYSVESLYETVNDDELKIDKIKCDENIFEQLDNKILIKEILKTLDKRSQQVIILRYFKEETQQKIADKLGISQVQVSRIEKKVLSELKDKLVN